MVRVTAWIAIIVTQTSWVFADDPTSVEYFENYIRPVLVEKCYECHSQAMEINGGLALDSKPGWERGGDSGPAIVAGKPVASRLIEALEYSNADLQMPPEGKLPAEVIDRFKIWIEAGAVDPRNQEQLAKNKTTALALTDAQLHWAYRPIAIPTAPGSTTPMASTPIDAFITRTLAAHELEASPLADDSALLRRLIFDLHGLPPTQSQLVDYLSDDDPEKYERLVERLIASPRFGERMARRWMDVARYAESITLRGFVLPQAWRYRDYLIAAFNEDRSFAEMIREQIAGDLIDSPDLEQRQQQMVATTFLAMGNTNLEEQVKTQLEMDYIDEQLELIGKAFMAQTIGCARCHDHKFDPIPTRDYYALAGIFRSTVAMEHENVSKWIERPLPLPPSELARFEALEKELASIKTEQAALEKMAKRASENKPLEAVPLSSLSGIVIDDTAAVRVGTWEASTHTKPYVGDGYLHDSHEKDVTKSVTFEPRKLAPGNYLLRMSYTAGANRCTHTTVRVFSTDGERKLTINQKETPPIDGLWIELGEYRFEKDGQAFVLLTNEQADGHVIADAVQFLPKEVAGSNKAVASAPDPNVKVADRSEKDAQSIQTALNSLKERRAHLESQLESRPKVLSILEQNPARDVPIHIRGNINNLGSVVPRGFLQLASIEARGPLPNDSSGRLELAQWLTDPRHPLTARVIANRCWTWIFGQGIVRTVDNFGTTGEEPFDSELLDYLANKLFDSQWSTKQLVREMVLSEAYRRATFPTERAQELDPDNRYFSHAMLKRIDAESMRDAMLQVSDELEIPGPGSTLRAGVKEDYRYQHVANLRAVYLPLLRNSLPELFDAFDFPNPSVPTGLRNQSTVAPQALSMLNSPWVHQRAVAAAEKLLSLARVDDTERLSAERWSELIDAAFVRCISRQPTAIERYTTTSLIEELQQQQLTELEIATRVVHGLFASLDFRYLD